MSKTLLIKNGLVIDPANKLEDIRDVLIENGKIIKVEKDIHVPHADVIDAKNLIVAPGLVDIHVHFRQPGQENKETIKSGSLAAAAGGFTSVACMANTNPPIDNLGTVELVKTIAKNDAIINVYPVAAVTKEMKGAELTEMGELAEAGVVAFSDDGLPITDAMVMRRALEYSSMFDKPILVHEEDPNLCCGGHMNEGEVSTRIGIPGKSPLSESVMVARDLILAKHSGKVHFCHMSSGESIRLIRKAKQEGLKVSAETAPHYLVLTEEAVEGYNTHAKMAPPLRTKVDLEELIKGIQDGTIDCIATDHAPHTRDDKNVEFNKAANGIIGLETALPVVANHLVHKKIISWSKLIELMSLNPARIVGLAKGTLSVGADADIVLIDPNLEKKVDVNLFKSKGRNCPFDGWPLKGWPVKTICGGQIVAG